MSSATLQQFPLIFFIKLFNGLRELLQKFFVDFLSGFAEIFYIYAAKKSFNISFLMEEGMVCEKQKLAGIAGDTRGNFEIDATSLRRFSPLR
ncbi:MAG: hypothetical protein OXC72_00295 [Roseovarius sp.]|nr:hypothetical protein [Roseovarius sp.]